LKRRGFITLLGIAAAWPRAARGQFQPAIIGVLGSGSAQSSAFLIDALKEGMTENGLAEGRDYVLDVRWAEGDYKRFAALAFELLKRKSSVIIVTTIAAALFFSGSVAIIFSVIPREILGVILFLTGAQLVGLIVTLIQTRSLRSSRTMTKA
jgi:hypothetical protein